MNPSIMMALPFVSAVLITNDQSINNGKYVYISLTPTQVDGVSDLHTCPVILTNRHVLEFL